MQLHTLWKKIYDGAYHESKQYDLLCYVNIYICVQDMLETDVQFDGDQNNPNPQIFIAIQNSQRQLKRYTINDMMLKYWKPSTSRQC